MINGKESFCRIENKYLVDDKTIPFLVASFKEHLDVDPYAFENGHYQVNTIYFDNKDDDVAERSLSHPTYKEKLRLRSYGGAKPIYFIEFKNKFTCDVFKVRIMLTEGEYEDFVFHQIVPKKNGNYKHDRFLDVLEEFIVRHGGIYPRSVIRYERMAFVNKPFDGYLRLTIDTGIRYRRDDFRLNQEGGALLLAPHEAILEIKIERALPLWLVKSLNDNDIYRMAFSKYGTSYLETQGKKAEVSLSPAALQFFSSTALPI